ncbi:IPTL-CTERM sorting domain-containing protein [Comamonas odontotermitis]
MSTAITNTLRANEPRTPALVPTLSHWALMLLSIALDGFAATSLRRIRKH